MRVLILLRGAPGCGKSTWIKENGLEPYALSADQIRLLCQSPVMQADGTYAISQDNDNVVWKTLFSILETRMQRGEFTVIDATNSKTAEINRYKEMCGTYRYRMYCVDFTDIPIEEVKRRNAGREAIKQVPEAVIDKIYSRFATQKIPAGVKVIRPDELNTVWFRKRDLSEYKRIHHIGDIHGCNTALQEYFKNVGGVKDDEFYIFTGDYIDRGVENAEVVKFLMSIVNKPNVLMLEGNHERWLWLWANECTGKSKEFELITRPELEAAKIDKKDARQLYRKFGQCAWYEYDGNEFLVTHAGLSSIPEELMTVATDQMIRGVGGYNDFEVIADAFERLTGDNCYQIHGHRNTKNLPIRVNSKVFNLEGRVEFGGDLRCVCIDHDGIHTYEIKNSVYRTPEVVQAQREMKVSPVSDTIIKLRQSKYIQERKFGDISSFNFTKAAFYDKAWDEQTVRARGLYIDTAKAKVAARAYNKFFNINERPETKFDMLQNKLQFPVTAYVKENGFLGIVSYNEYEDDLLIASKSMMDGDFAGYLKNILYAKLSPSAIEYLKCYLKEHDVSFVFECIDMENDPHIIEYPENRLVLLDIVHNSMGFVKYSYDQMCDVANQFGLEHKVKAYEIEDWQHFFDWYYDVLNEDYEYRGKKIEGFVIEDAFGYMVKLKLAYYNFWKFMRNVAHEAIRNGYIRRTAALTTPLANEFYGWVKTLHGQENVPSDICSLRKMFYASR